MAKCLSVDYTAAASNPPTCFMKESEITEFMNQAKEYLSYTAQIKKSLTRAISIASDAYSGNDSSATLRERIISLNNRIDSDFTNITEQLPSMIKRDCVSHMEKEANELVKKVYNEYDNRVMKVVLSLRNYNIVANNKNKSSIKEGEETKYYKTYSFTREHLCKIKGHCFYRYNLKCNNGGESIHDKKELASIYKNINRIKAMTLHIKNLENLILSIESFKGK
ncbi:MAG: hypothetical protein GX951_03360 [Mollicutes bacterium]|nr:hypothetical protein [Mollicutes bacterium]